MNGLGKFKAYDQIYVGEWNRKINGKGVYHWDNGDSYEGTFLENQRSGYG